MLSMALHLREQDLSLREIAARLVIAQGTKKCRHPSCACCAITAAASRMRALVRSASRCRPAGSWSCG
ncbi:hypothetical protein [Nonomuraea guangzhouensis]|uniref:Helix-turn-helix domain-containing protein n=1 Tax=Nonomuraea guangzhouensis TaxID=1291555 RepID=A0ABW4GBQ9_9ACTN|nr:hypothetical protein [Nonomuraea guangzhouensis]